ncbi:hypothetical protein DFH09DRAFT_1077678 [Mycena vulgaris]|nr:hypothetical protein DFH09DRAFT_1077678 [Mycena vulgaris]
MSKPRRASPFAVRDEFLDLEFPSVAATHAYANHPSMHRLSSEYLEPMVRYFLRIREEFSWEPHTKTEREHLDIRQFVCAYFEHADRWIDSESDGIFQEHLSDMIIRCAELAAARRIPCPGIRWINIVMRAENVYGFDGDEDTVFKAIMRGKIASLYRYSADLQKGAVDRQFVGDAPAGDFDYPFVAGEPSLESIHDYVAVPPVLISHLEQYCAFHRDAVKFAGTPDDLLRYVITILRGFAHILRLCIPADALSFGIPLLIVSSSLFSSSRNMSRKLEYDLDVAIPLNVICLPCTPPWTASEIETLANVAEYKFWGLEQCLLQTEHETSDRLIEKLERAHLYAYQRFGLGTSERTTV